MLNIYEYTQAHSFLKDCWEEKKKSNPSFSMRAWAKSLGFTNNSPLSLMLKGQRPIPKKYIPSFITSLDLAPNEGKFLEVLIDYSSAKTDESKDLYLKRLKALTPKKTFKINEVESFKYLENPIHMTLLEMSELKVFKWDVDWIQENLIQKISKDEINEAIKVLLTLGLIEEDNGTYKKTYSNMSTRPDQIDMAVQSYHRNVLKLAALAVKEQGVEEREYNAYALNIKKSDMPAAKSMIREFSKNFIAEFEAAPKEGELTYQLNVQLFKLSSGGS